MRLIDYLSVRVRVLLALGALIVLILVGSVVLILYTYQMETIIKRDVQANFESVDLGHDLKRGRTCLVLRSRRN